MKQYSMLAISLSFLSLFSLFSGTLPARTRAEKKTVSLCARELEKAQFSEQDALYNKGNIGEDYVAPASNALRQFYRRVTLFKRICDQRKAVCSQALYNRFSVALTDLESHYFAHQNGWGMGKHIYVISPDQFPHLHKLVEEVAQKANIPAPFLLLADDSTFQTIAASSLGSDASICLVGRSVLEELTDDQIKAVLAHELSHVIKNHVPTIKLFRATLYQFFFILLALLLIGIMYYFGYRSRSERRFIIGLIGVLCVVRLAFFVPHLISHFGGLHRCRIEHEADRSALTLLPGEKGKKDLTEALTALDKMKQELIDQTGLRYEKEKERITDLFKEKNSVIETALKKNLDALWDSRVKAQKILNKRHPSLADRIAHLEEAG